MYTSGVVVETVAVVAAVVGSSCFLSQPLHSFWAYQTRQTMKNTQIEWHNYKLCANKTVTLLERNRCVTSFCQLLLLFFTRYYLPACFSLFHFVYSLFCSHSFHRHFAIYIYFQTNSFANTNSNFISVEKWLYHFVEMNKRMNKKRQQQQFKSKCEYNSNRHETQKTHTHRDTIHSIEAALFFSFSRHEI